MKHYLQVIVPIAMQVILTSIAEAQPVPVTEIPQSSTHFKTIANLVYFTADDQLWRTDGTAEGTILLKSGFDGFSEFEEHHERLYFRSSSTGGLNPSYNQLWTSDGTTAGTVLLMTSSKHNVVITASNSSLVFFQASEASTGRELFRTNGTPGGTALVKDINPGSADGFGGYAAVVQDQIFFAGNDGTTGLEPWKSDGTAAGTSLIKDINPGSESGFGNIFGTGSFNVYSFNDLYFFRASADDLGAFTGAGSEPWVSDGTEEGTRLLVDAFPGWDSPGIIRYGVDHKGFLYTIIWPGEDSEMYTGAANLWKTAGTPESTTMIRLIGDNASPNEYHSFRVMLDKVYFFNRSDYFYDNLWVSDGTTEGTYNVANLITMDGGVTVFEEINNFIVFAGTAQTYPTPFYRTDGVSGQTEFYRLQSLGHQGERFPFEPRLTKVGDLGFLDDHDGPAEGDGGTPYDQDDYFHLFQTDAITTKSMRSLYGVNTIGTNNITNFNGKVLFTTHNDQSGSTTNVKRLWIYDPEAVPPPTGRFFLVNTDTDADIKAIVEDDLITLPSGTNYTIRYEPSKAVGSVSFTLAGRSIRRENAAPYSIAGDLEGDYNPWNGSGNFSDGLTATAYSGAGGTGEVVEEVVVRFLVHHTDQGSGEILREQWNNVSGTTVPAIPVNRDADASQYIVKFEAPENIGDNYGARIRGYVIPPLTGQYTFWIASNDHSELWLSTDDNPANKRRIANLTRATNPREWNKFGSQQSAAIPLIAGKKYYIEALHKEGVGSDHVAVGWRLPDGTMERPIPGNRLVPWLDGSSSTPEVTITNPTAGQTFSAPADITIEADAFDGDDGTITKVEFLVMDPSNGALTLIATDTDAPYHYVWEDVAAGDYQIVARATDADGNSKLSQPVDITVNEDLACTASGTITREFWTGVQGARVSDIPQNTSPDGSEELTSLEGPTNAGTNYGARISGYICPPLDGEYFFLISSNDHSELWLSTDDDPANRQRIAHVTGATAPREWDKYPTQISAAIPLIKGVRYYIEVLHKQGIGTDHVAVAWQLPDMTFEGPIPGSRLSPAIGTNAFAARMSGADDVFEQISVYPNPASRSDSELTVSGFKSIDQSIETDVEIINLTGDVVFADRIKCGGECASYRLNTNGQLVPGVYLINFKTKDVRHTRRLLVK